MTSPCLYWLVRFGPCACLSFTYVQNLPVAYAFAVVGLHSLPSVFYYFLVPFFLYGLPYLGIGLCLTVGFAFLQPTLFLLPSPSIPLYYFCYEIVCLNPTGPIWACCLFLSQWPNTTIGSFITSLASSCVPFVFPWASQARLLSLGFLSHFLNIAFPWAFTKFFGLPWPNYIIPHPWGS